MDDPTLLERLLDERAVIAGIAMEVVVLAGGLGWISAGAVAAITGILRQVVTPHRTDRGEGFRRKLRQRRHDRRGRRERRRHPMQTLQVIDELGSWPPAPALRDLRSSDTSIVLPAGFSSPFAHWKDGVQVIDFDFTKGHE